MESQVNQTGDQPASKGKKWWQTDELAPTSASRLLVGEPCPKCYLADLDYDSLFRLHCPNCGYVAECGTFT